MVWVGVGVYMRLCACLRVVIFRLTYTVTFKTWHRYLLLLLQNILEAKILIAIPNQIITSNTSIQVDSIMTVISVNVGFN